MPSVQENIDRLTKQMDFIAVNRDKLRADSLERERQKNLESVKRYQKARSSKDPEWKRMLAMRGRVCSLLVRKWAVKDKSFTVDLVEPQRLTTVNQTAYRLCGCTWAELRAHFESQFKDGMTWMNHGKDMDKWCIDHKKPICLFDWWTYAGLKEAFNWKNLQPIWVYEHRAKSQFDCAESKRRRMADKDYQFRVDNGGEIDPTYA